METYFSQPIIFIVILKIYLGLVLLRKIEIFVLFCYTVYGGKFVVKEKKNNPKLAVNIMQETRERNYVPGVLHTDTFVVFRSIGIPAEFCVFVINTREIVLLILEPKKQGKT